VKTPQVKPIRTRRAGDLCQPDWNLSLYIAGASPLSCAALKNLEQICDEHLAGRYHIEVIDLTKNPSAAQVDQVVALPMVIRKRPSPMRRIIGDLSNTARVLIGLDIPILVPQNDVR
jgi:circadian clock protein KaiB